MSSDLLAVGSDPVAHEYERITHKNVKVFIIFDLLLFSVALLTILLKQFKLRHPQLMYRTCAHVQHLRLSVPN